MGIFNGQRFKHREVFVSTTGDGRIVSGGFKADEFFSGEGYR